MKLDELKSAYELRSSKVSDYVRQLSFAGIGLVWVFRDGAGQEAPHLDSRLIVAALLMAVTLTIDLIHYLLGTIILFLYFRHKEKAGTKRDDEFTMTEALTWPTWILFYLKTGTMLMAYSWFLIPFLWARFYSR
ncbi:MAG: hypothetical protein HY858_08445 [Candidatus Solibacter usitatus]|nr:hypothetical protein [Candidatus Solibacter usitatus]